MEKQGHFEKGRAIGLLHYYRLFDSHSSNKINYFLFLSFLSSVMDSMSVVTLLPLLNVIELGGDAIAENSAIIEFFTNFFAIFNIPYTITSTLLLIVAIILAKNVILFFAILCKTWMRTTMSAKLKRDFHHDLSAVSLQFFNQKSTGHFSSIINIQIDRFVKAFMQYISILAAIISIASYTAVAVILDWKIASSAIIFGVFIIIIFHQLNSYIGKQSILYSDQTNRLMELAVQSIQSFKYAVSTQNIERLEAGSFSAINKIENISFKMAGVNALTKCLKEPIVVFGLVALIIALVNLFDQPIVTVLVSLLLFQRALNSLLGAQLNWQTFIGSVGAIDLVNKEFAELSKNKEKNGKVFVRSLKEQLKFDNVTFLHPNSVNNGVKNLSMKINAKSIVAIIGSSGSGKTTLVDIVTLLNRPQSGKIFIDGVDATEVNLSSWRQQIGYVCQDMVIYNDTIANNVCLWDGNYSQDKKIEKRVDTVLRDVGLYEACMDMPNGMNSIVGDRGVNLSGGQRQRLFLAREMFRKPKLLILDEATSALDAYSEKILQNTLVKLKQKTTIIVITHRLNSISNTDYIYILNGGKIAGHGSYADIKKNHAKLLSSLLVNNRPE